MSTLKKVIAGLGLSITILTSGFIGTHENFDGQWLTNADYNALKTALMEKVERKEVLTISEWRTLTKIYDHEIKKGINKEKFENVTKDNIIPKLNQKFK